MNANISSQYHQLAISESEYIFASTNQTKRSETKRSEAKANISRQIFARLKKRPTPVDVLSFECLGNDGLFYVRKKRLLVVPFKPPPLKS